MKSYYSIMLFIMFAVVMAVTVICNTIIMRNDFTPADGAIISLTILAIIMAYRLSQAEKRIAHLEEMVDKDQHKSGKLDPVKLKQKGMKTSEIIDKLEEEKKKVSKKETEKITKA